MSWGPCQQLWSQEWDGKEVTGRVGVQAVVQKGRRALRKGGIKRNLRIKRREAGSKLGHCWCSWHPAVGPALSRDPSPPPASEEFGVSLSRKDRAASDTQEERPERRNPGAAPEVGEGRLAGSGAWCQESGWRDVLGSTEGQGLRVEDPHAQAQVRSPGQSAGVTEGGRGGEERGSVGRRTRVGEARNWLSSGVKARPGVLEEGLHYSLC